MCNRHSFPSVTLFFYFLFVQVIGESNSLRLYIKPSQKKRGFEKNPVGLGFFSTKLAVAAFTP